MKTVNILDKLERAVTYAHIDELVATREQTLVRVGHCHADELAGIPFGR